MLPRRCARSAPASLSTLILSPAALSGVALLLAAATTAGCNPKAAAVHTRAANDLACPSSKIEVRELGGSAYMATGCDQAVTYVCQREASRENYEKDSGIGALFFAGDNDSVACIREGEVKSLNARPPVGAASGAESTAGAGPSAGAGGGRCPAGSRWDGARCVGDVAVTCPPGHRFEVNIGCVPGAAPAGAAAAPAASKSCPPGMAFVPGGTFTDDTGKPSTTRDLCVDLTEVTASAYTNCSSRGACSSDGLTSCGGAVSTFVGFERGDHPINCVTWAQAAVYCKAEGKRLPTDHEWQWVAHGGGSGTPFPWGDASPADRGCWAGASKRDATCVAGTPAGDINPQQILGLAGNVAEWTATARGADVKVRVVRGGYYGTAAAAESGLLGGVEMDVMTRAAGIGFRCVAAPR